jgi:hypothetical protein
MTEVPEPESLEETYKRLSPYNGDRASAPRPPAPPVAPRVYAAAMPAVVMPGPLQAAAELPPAEPLPPANRLVPIISVAAVAVALVVAVTLGSVFSVLRSTASDATAQDPDTAAPSSAPVAPSATPAPAVVDEWTTYPGSAFVDSADVLAAPSQETVVTESEAFLDEFTRTLTADLGVTWTETWSGMLEKGSNGYGGESMLYDYYSAEMIGTVKLDDPKARQKVRDLLETMTADAGGAELLFSNEVDKDDLAASLEQFGAADVSDQAMWAFYGRDAIAPGLSVSSRVFDTNFPTDATFNGDTWFRVDGSRSGMFYVKIQLSTYGLLSEADRADFEKKLAAYDESAKPPSR